MEFRDDGLVTIEQPGKLPKFTLEDFQNGESFGYVFRNYGASPEVLALKKTELAAMAKEVGFTGFSDVFKAFMTSYRRNGMSGNSPGITEFSNAPIQLSCGIWECNDNGIFRNTLMGKQIACSHPILPVERLRNIDTGVIQYRLAFMRSRKQKKWEEITVNAATISKAREITSLAEKGVSVTSSTASALVDFLNDVCDLNYDTIPESKSIGRLGYIPGEGFFPYMDGVTFDGDDSFRNLYNSVRIGGSLNAWCNLAEECCKMSTTAKILLAASFASPLLSVVGSLPFFVHLWGVDSGTGKTVGLMLAASVWGDPALGSYTQTFNATQVGQERTAAFLNHLPFCIDELQLTKDSRGKSNFDVYQLAQGVGRARGRRNGGIDAAPTWNCCFLTTGESPIVSGSAGAGAVNRVIDIECNAGSVVVTDGHRIAGGLKKNYGHAGNAFISRLYDPNGLDERLDMIRGIYEDFKTELDSGESTEKQSMAAAAILTADVLARLWVFGDDPEEDQNALTADDIRRFLASKESVSAGHRAYTWLCDWVASSVNHFNTDQNAAVGEVYGFLEGDMAYIIPSVFRNALAEAGYSDRATLSFLRSNGLIETAKPDEFTKLKRFGRSSQRYIWLHLKNEMEAPEFDEEPL